MDLLEELRSIVEALDREMIPYALCGGLAVAVHGVVRATEDIDLLIRPDDIVRAKATLKPLGFMLDSGEIPFHSDAGTMAVIHRVGKSKDSDFLSVDFLVVDSTTESAWQSTENYSVGEFALSCISKPPSWR